VDDGEEAAHTVGEGFREIGLTEVSYFRSTPCSPSDRRPPLGVQDVEACVGWPMQSLMHGRRVG